MSTVLEGRSALVTGGASGIGRAIAAAYIDAGAEVVIADRDPRVAEVATEIGAHLGEILDATSEQDVDALVDSIVGDQGRLDILVCSHGILTQSPAAEMSTVMWRRPSMST